MSADITDGLKLTIEFPEPWTVISSEQLSRVELLDVLPTAGSGLRAAVGQLAASGKPDLTARMLQPLVGDDGEALVVLMAACSVYLYRSRDIAGPSSEQSCIRRDLQLTTDVAADFYELALPVISDDHQMLAILAFSTPNLPIVLEMEALFRSIAATARFDQGQVGSRGPNATA